MGRARCRDLRRAWISRLHDQDGFGDDPGGIERWLILTDGLGLDRRYVTLKTGALPATRYAVEAYVRFVLDPPLTVAVASSLTELFALKIHRERICGMLENYDFISEDVLGYFRTRISQAPRDAEFALDYVKTRVVSRAEQEACIDAVRFKCNMLWAQLDALYHAYVAPGHIPPGAFKP